MNYTELITRYPTPPNIAALNLELVAAIRDPAMASSKQKNLEKLFHSNIGLVSYQFRRCNYGMPIEEMLGYLWEAIPSAVESYDQSKSSFATYLVMWLWHFLQKAYKADTLIQIPSNRDLDMKYSNDPTLLNSLPDESEETETDLSSDAMKILDSFEATLQCVTRPKELRDLEMTKLHLKGKTFQEIGDAFEITKQAANVAVTKCLDRIRLHAKNLGLEY